jgi:hypothetical protein
MKSTRPPGSASRPRRQRGSVRSQGADVRKDVHPGRDRVLLRLLTYPRKGTSRYVSPRAAVASRRSSAEPGRGAIVSGAGSP